jgi:hypothetical protein
MSRFHGSTVAGYWYHLSSAFVLLMNILIEILPEQYLRMQYLRLQARAGGAAGSAAGARAPRVSE